MSAPLITKEDVTKAIAALKTAGIKTTRQAVHAFMGSKGSMSTVVKFMRELESEEKKTSATPEEEEAFHTIWNSAKDEGRAERDETIKDLEDAITTLSSEVEALTGESTALRAQAADAIKKHEEAAAREIKLRDDLTSATEKGERNATKLVEVMENHQQEAQHLRLQLDQANSRAHAFELDLAGARAKLEVAIPPKST
jgi:chromosome segregation ATPase